jgi:hypothetical protein
MALIILRSVGTSIALVASSSTNSVGTATHYMVQSAATLVIIGAQIVIAFLLALLLTVVALILIEMGATVGFVMLRRAHDFGALLSRLGIELMHETSQFLGGLKLAAGQNRQANFIAEFQNSLERLKREQLAYLGQENRNRLAASIADPDEADTNDPEYKWQEPDNASEISGSPTTDASGQKDDH